MKKYTYKKEEISQMTIRLPKSLHVEIKAQAAYRNQTMFAYVLEAVIYQIERDKQYQ